MSMRHRFGIAVATFAVVVASAAAPVLAGNWAEVDYGTGLAEPPAAGEERELRLVLLQHGVTPVNDGEVLVTAVLPGSDEVVSVAASPVGDGAWTASITFPAAGEWQVRVTHSVFETPDAVAVTVATGDIGWVSIAPVVGVAAAALVLLLVATSFVRRARGHVDPAPVAAARTTSGAAAPVEPSRG